MSIAKIKNIHIFTGQILENMTRKILLSVLIFLVSFVSLDARLSPTGTYKFAENGSQELYLDFYAAAPGSATEVNGVKKPTILFAFGGGFMTGTRDDKFYDNWFTMLTQSGYSVVSIDYRLGLKGVTKMGTAQAGLLRKAIYMGVEDMFSATAWLAAHDKELGIDAGNMVVSGSSAGAIISLQCVYEIANRTKYTKVLPDGFNYAGVMSFAGAIFSTKGKLRFKNTPCPTLLFHGTADKVVEYSQIKVLNIGFFGSDKVAERYARAGIDYTFWRHLDHGHEIASVMAEEDTWKKETDFLENVVCGGRRGTVDQVINSTWIKYTKGTAADLYKKQSD